MFPSTNKILAGRTLFSLESREKVVVKAFCFAYEGDGGKNCGRGEDCGWAWGYPDIGWPISIKNKMLYLEICYKIAAKTGDGLVGVSCAGCVYKIKMSLYR